MTGLGGPGTRIQEWPGNHCQRALRTWIAGKVDLGDQDRPRRLGRPVARRARGPGAPGLPGSATESRYSQASLQVVLLAKSVLLGTAFPISSRPQRYDRQDNGRLLQRRRWAVERLAMERASRASDAVCRDLVCRENASATVGAVRSPLGPSCSKKCFSLSSSIVTDLPCLTASMSERAPAEVGPVPGSGETLRCLPASSGF